MLGGRGMIEKVNKAKVGRKKYNCKWVIGGQWVFSANVAVNLFLLFL